MNKKLTISEFINHYKQTECNVKKLQLISRKRKQFYKRLMKEMEKELASTERKETVIPDPFMITFIV
jgi:hypothetical protein